MSVLTKRKAMLEKRIESRRNFMTWLAGMGKTSQHLTAGALLGHLANSNPLLLK